MFCQTLFARFIWKLHWIVFQLFLHFFLNLNVHGIIPCEIIPHKSQESLMQWNLLFERKIFFIFHHGNASNKFLLTIPLFCAIFFLLKHQFLISIVHLWATCMNMHIQWKFFHIKLGHPLSLFQNKEKTEQPKYALFRKSVVYCFEIRLCNCVIASILKEVFYCFKVNVSVVGLFQS